MSAVRDMARFVSGAGPAGLAAGGGDARGGEDATFTLDPAEARALADLLAAYRDPDDHGGARPWRALSTTTCGCTACGRVDGIFGQALAVHAEGGPPPAGRRLAKPGWWWSAIRK